MYHYAIDAPGVHHLPVFFSTSKQAAIEAFNTVVAYGVGEVRLLQGNFKTHDDEILVFGRVFFIKTFKRGSDYETD